MNKFTLTIFTAAALALTAYSRLRPPAEKTVYAAVTPVSRLAAKANRNPVTLQGHLISKLGPEKYLFRDPSGSVAVIIENEDWNGLYIHRSDKVQIHGELRNAVRINNISPNPARIRIFDEPVSRRKCQFAAKIPR